MLNIERFHLMRAFMLHYPKIQGKHRARGSKRLNVQPQLLINPFITVESSGAKSFHQVLPTSTTTLGFKFLSHALIVETLVFNYSNLLFSQPLILVYSLFSSKIHIHVLLTICDILIIDIINFLREQIKSYYQVLWRENFPHSCNFYCALQFYTTTSCPTSLTMTTTTSSPWLQENSISLYKYFTELLVHTPQLLELPPRIIVIKI